MVVSTFSLITTTTVIMTYNGDHSRMEGVSCDSSMQPHREVDMANQYLQKNWNLRPCLQSTVYCHGAFKDRSMNSEFMLIVSVS